LGHYGRCVFVAIAVVVTLFVLSSSNTLHGQASTPGGFIDSATSVGLRPRFSSAQSHAWLPTRGTFTFPTPYSTQGVRLTNASDCGGSSDCVVPVGYSYWSNVNNHTNRDTMLIVLGLDRQADASRTIVRPQDRGQLPAGRNQRELSDGRIHYLVHVALWCVVSGHVALLFLH